MVFAQPLRNDYLRLHPLKHTPKAAGPRSTSEPAEPAGRQSGAVSKQSDQRLRLIMFVFAAAFAVVIGRALYVQILQASALAARAHGQQNSTIVVPTSRGRILDATGNTLAVDVPAKDLMVDPAKVQDPGQVASYIAQKLGYQIKHKKAFKAEVRCLVGRLTAPHVVQAIVLSQLDPAVAAEIMSAHPPGLFTLDSVRRDYPSGKLASQLIGYVDYNNSGTLGSGIEHEYNSVLGGHPGEQLEVRGPGGVPLSTVTLRRAQQGRDVQLTIDRSIQQKVQSVLDATVSRTGAHSATALVLDPRNGSILAMATAPGYDNNDVHDLSHKQFDARHPQHGGRVLLRARLDLQGGDDGRRADGRDRHAADAVPDPVRDQGRRPDRARRRPCARPGRSRPPRSCSSRRTWARSRSPSSCTSSRCTTGSGAGASAAQRTSACRPRRRAPSCRPTSGTRPRSATSRSARASRSRRCRWRPCTPASPTAA